MGFIAGFVPAGEGISGGLILSKAQKSPPENPLPSEKKRYH
jgi:hypothetical protein